MVAWKRGLAGPKFSYENLSPSPTLSYTITKKPKKEFFAAQKSWRVVNLLRVFIDRVVFRFHSDSVLLRFLIDSVLFGVLSDRGSLRVFSDRLFFRVLSNRFFSWVIGTLFSVIPAIFLSKRATSFLSKTYFVLHYIVKRISHLTISLTFFHNFIKADSKKEETKKSV